MDKSIPINWMPPHLLTLLMRYRMCVEYVLYHTTSSAGKSTKVFSQRSPATQVLALCEGTVRSRGVPPI